MSLLGGGTRSYLFYKELRVGESYLTLCNGNLPSEGAVEFVKPKLATTTKLSWKSSKVVGNLVFLKYRVQIQDSI